MRARVCLVIVLSACATNGNEEGASTGSDSSTFASDIATPLSAHCGNCHGTSNPSEQLVLSGISASALKANLVGRSSRQAAGEQLVVAGDPDHSYLVLKLRGTQAGVTCASGCGSKMPITGSFPAANLDALTSWIAEGAP